MATVLVTGGTGYLGGWCVTQLLDQGHTVRTTVRSLDKADAVRGAVARGLGGSTDALANLTFHAADLMSDDGWPQAVAGCDYVLHVASPLNGTDGDDDSFIRPALEGTRRVLGAAAAAGVKRVVLTSSVAAATPASSIKSGTFDEATWTDPNEPGLSAYRRSKVLAEKAAWEFASDHPQTQLVTILPAAIFGPTLSLSALSSLEIIARLLDGKLPGVFRMGFEVVDVRDVASLHLLAMTSDQAAGQRYIASGNLRWMKDIAEILRARLGAAADKVPTRTIPDVVVKIMGRFNHEIANLVPTLSRDLVRSSAKARSELGWTTNATEDTIVDSARSVLDLREQA